MRSFLLAAALSVGWIANAAASFIVTFSEVGSDVVAGGSGSLNLGSLVSSPTSIDRSNLIPRYANVFLGSGPNDTFPNAVFGPTSFGFGGSEINANSSLGDFVSIGGLTNVLAVPQGYTSGSVLSDRDVFSGTTFASLGLAPGTYAYTLRDGSDTITVQIGPGTPPATVPEPASLAMLAASVVGLVAARKRRAG